MIQKYLRLFFAPMKTVLYTAKMKRFGLLIVLLVSAFTLSTCRSVPLSGRKQLILVDENVIVEQSLVQYRQFVNQMPKSTDKAKINRVMRVCQRVAKATDLFLKENKISGMEMDWEFSLIADRRVNAFCMPGGKIVIFTGILPLCKTDDELATVIAHEVSHAVARHSNERLSHEVLRQLGGNIIARASAREGAVVQTVINQAYGLGSQMVVTLPYSRNHEYEADRMGLFFMAMAGYDPRSAVSFWQKMARQNSGNSTPEFLSTHPSDENRIKKIQEYMSEAMTYYEGAVGKTSKKSTK